MRSSKSRSRNKSNRQRTLGNVVNRVFDSSGPEGKVRGTPQQIIEKYLTLARDAQLSNDRVAEQSFLQHAEHYTRMLGEAQREQAERQQNQQQSQRDDDSRDSGNGARDGGNGQQNNNGDNRQHERGERNESRESRRDERQSAAQQHAPRQGAGATATRSDSGLPPVISGDQDSGPVSTPESAVLTVAEPAATEPSAEATPAPRRRTRAATGTASRAPRSRKKAADTEGAQPDKEASSGE